MQTVRNGCDFCPYYVSRRACTYVDPGKHECKGSVYAKLCTGTLHCRCPELFITLLYLQPGNGIIDETEFLQWVARIQALRDDPTTNSSKMVSDEDDITQDLIAAFR